MPAGPPASSPDRAAPAPRPGRPGTPRVRAPKPGPAPHQAPHQAPHLAPGLAPGLALGLALVLLAACSALPELDFNPLVRIQHRPDGAVEIEALGPLIDVRSGPEGLSHAFHPLYQHTSFFQGDEMLSSTDIIAPFWRHETRNNGTRCRFWPLFWSGTRTDFEAGPKWQAMLIPFFWAGNGPAEDDAYFAFWPLGGRVRNLFGLHTYDFALWPLFMRTRMDATADSVSWTVLLLGGWTTGGPRDGSWRALPFYRHRLWRAPDGTLRTDQQTVLWPFFTWGYDHMDTETSEHTGLWPLYSHHDADSWSRTTVLWPFFRYNHELVEQDPDFSYHLPWPLFRWSKVDDADHLRLFPFYSRYDSEELSSRAWLLGFVREMRFPGREAVPTQGSFDVFPFWHDAYLPREGGDETHKQLWPLAHRDAAPDGRLDEAVLSITPFRQLDFMKPVEESWQPLFSAWHRERAGDVTETRAAWDMYFHRIGPEGESLSVPGYSVRPDGPDGRVTRWAWGAITSREDAVGTTEVTLFGVNIWLR